MNLIYTEEKPSHINLVNFRRYADSEVDIEIDSSSAGNKTSSIVKQKLILNGFYIVSELNDVFKKCLL